MSIDPAADGGYLTKIRYPYEIFEPGNIPQYLSVIAGNLFGLGKLEAVRLLDIDIPDALRRHHTGPKFGIEGVRKIVGTEVSRRPHVLTKLNRRLGIRFSMLLISPVGGTRSLRLANRL